VGYFGVFPNPDLKPETSTNKEIGIKQGFKLRGFKGFLDVAYFQQDYKNTIEYLFGIWDINVTPFGFKFLNTGDSRVRGWDISIMGRTDEDKKWQFSIYAGYTRVNPISLTPNYVFAYDASANEPQPLTYIKTSMDTTGHLLKYRFKDLIKSDEELKYKKWAIGHSIRYYSSVQNIDTAFALLELITAFVPSIEDIKVIDFWKKNMNGTFVNDFRLSYMFDTKQKISFVVSNAFNKIYSLRPMKVESPRTFAIQYRVEF
jgi:outer membrane receptor protein involved in Fe transport